MKYYKYIKSFLVEFIITFLLFFSTYILTIFLLGLGSNYRDITMGFIVSILISISRVSIKQKNEETQEFIRNNYWKLKNELNRKINGPKKRNSK